LKINAYGGVPKILLKLDWKTGYMIPKQAQ
jgi:hypothetical protein